MTRKETVEEYLARGGKITKIPYVPPEQKANKLKTNTSGGLPTLMSLDEGAHFFAEKKKKKTISSEDFLKKIEDSSLSPELVKQLTKKED